MKLNKTKINYIIRKMNAGMSTRRVAEDLQISHERVRQIYISYLKTGEFPNLKQVGRPKKILTEFEINAILEGYSKHLVSASILSKILKI